MAWKHGFVIEYVPKKRKRKRRKRKAEAAPERTGEQRTRGVHPAKKAVEPQVRSVLSVKGLHVDRVVRDAAGRVGHVVSLTRKEAVVDFDDGSTARFTVPDDFVDGKVSVVKQRR